MKQFSELGLSSEILKAIDRLGFEQASPIQAEAIPLLMAGHDLVGQSQTGSGKTAAFGIPALERTEAGRKEVQVLILCPTRELAVQVSEEVYRLAAFKRGVHALPIYGGQSYDRQIYGLKQGAQIVIGTPGRVMDHMRRGTLRLETVGMVILDEADVMLDMGFKEDIETILQGVPAERQTVFFSATMPPVIRQLIEQYSRDPKNVSIERKTVTVPTVEQVYYEVDRRFKVELLTRLIDLHDLELGIIFCNTKRMVDDLADHLEAQGYAADRLHGDMSQAQRDRVMNKFRKSGLEFLVATDVAARGIDVSDLQVVFNYDMPYDVEDYVHRIGRTGRAGKSGRAISFVSGREVFRVRNIERYTNMRIQRGRVPTLREVEDARQNFLLDEVRETLKSGVYERRDHVLERLLEEGHTTTDVAMALLHQLLGGVEGESEGRSAEGEARRAERGEQRAGGKGQRSEVSGQSAEGGSQESVVEARGAAVGGPEASGQSAEVKGQESGGEAQGEEARGQRSEGKGQQAEGEEQGAEVGGEESDAGARRAEPRAQSSEPRVQRTESRGQRGERAWDRDRDRPRDRGSDLRGGERGPRRDAAPERGPRRDSRGRDEGRYERRERRDFRDDRGGRDRGERGDRGGRGGDRDRQDRGERRAPWGERRDDRRGPGGEFRGQRSADRNQGSEVRGQRSEGRGPRTEFRSQRSEVKGRRPEGRERERFGDRERPVRSGPDRDRPWEKKDRGREGDRPGKPREGDSKVVRGKASRRTPEGQTRLHMNVGKEAGISPVDVVNAVCGETGLPGSVVGTVDVRERHLFADVKSEHARAVMAKLNRGMIKGNRVKVKKAD